jgi:hypothetical protein
MTTKYGKSSQKEVKNEMHRLKKGTAVSGKKKTKVTSKKQAIAIALSKARKKGAKVPKKAKSKTKKSPAKKKKSSKKKKSK